MVRQLRDRGSEEERRRAYNESGLHDPTTVDAEEKDTKRARTARWTVQVQQVAPIDPRAVDPTDPASLSAAMGFADFGSTKGLHVFGNQDGPLPAKLKRRQYRQMLHVKGIYNIPMTKQQLEERDRAKSNSN